MQVAAVCFHSTNEGLEFRLVRTTRGRWTFPKGHVDKHEPEWEAAKREAHAEAGASGEIWHERLTTYRHGFKKGGKEVTISAYLMKVTATYKPSKPYRKPKWFTAEEAVAALSGDRHFEYAEEAARVVKEAVRTIGWKDAGPTVISTPPHVSSRVAPTNQQRDRIFISYSHSARDKRYYEEFLKMLRPSAQKRGLKIWSDREIEPGADWRGEIEKALAHTKIGVLLVSPDYLASDFIAQHELPPLLEAAATGGARIFWIACRHCSVEDTEIEKFQGVTSPSRPLAELRPVARREKEWKRIAQELLKMALR
jgi:8-oxo-dGTP pyrophosphatase MutT (NUDIX family)